MKILYEDNHILVVDKPAGLLTQPNETGDPSLEQLCKNYIRSVKDKKGEVYLHALHRLDKCVSGIVLFAKTSKALTRLNATSRNKQTKKVYLATLEGIPKEVEGELIDYLIHDHHRAKVASADDPDAKLAKLYYHILEVKGGQATVQIILETGRYHQIRIQCAHMGCPIVGDAKYGAKTPHSQEGIALKHTSLTIEHPITHEILEFNAHL